MNHFGRVCPWRSACSRLLEDKACVRQLSLNFPASLSIPSVPNESPLSDTCWSTGREPCSPPPLTQTPIIVYHAGLSHPLPTLPQARGPAGVDRRRARFRVCLLSVCLAETWCAAWQGERDSTRGGSVRSSGLWATGKETLSIMYPPPPPQGESKGVCICKGKATATRSGSWRGWHKQWQPSRSQCDSVRPLKEMEGGGGDFRQANLLSHTETSVSPVRPSCPTQQHPGAADTPRRVAREAQLRHDRPLLRRHNIQRHGMPE